MIFDCWFFFVVVEMQNPRNEQKKKQPKNMKRPKSDPTANKKTRTHTIDYGCDERQQQIGNR